MCTLLQVKPKVEKKKKKEEVVPAEHPLDDPVAEKLRQQRYVVSCCWSFLATNSVLATTKKDDCSRLWGQFRSVFFTMYYYSV